MVVLLDACSGLPAWRESSQAIRTTLAGGILPSASIRVLLVSLEQKKML